MDEEWKNIQRNATFILIWFCFFFPSVWRSFMICLLMLWWIISEYSLKIWVDVYYIVLLLIPSWDMWQRENCLSIMFYWGKDMSIHHQLILFTSDSTSRTMITWIAWMFSWIYAHYSLTSCSLASHFLFLGLYFVWETKKPCCQCLSHEWVWPFVSLQLLSLALYIWHNDWQVHPPSKCRNAHPFSRGKLKIDKESERDSEKSMWYFMKHHPHVLLVMAVRLLPMLQIVWFAEFSMLSCFSSTHSVMKST